MLIFLSDKAIVVVVRSGHQRALAATLDGEPEAVEKEYTHDTPA